MAEPNDRLDKLVAEARRQAEEREAGYRARALMRNLTPRDHRIASDLTSQSHLT